MKALQLFSGVFVACCIWTISLSQTSDRQVFVGSTPSDLPVRESLKIPSSAISEFIKWELRLINEKNNNGTFELIALYGESQPNTNGFKGGGTRILLKGKYSSRAVESNSRRQAITLRPDQGAEQFVLIKMDNNILHFADNNKKLLVGNAGNSYILNRVEK